MINVIIDQTSTVSDGMDRGLGRYATQVFLAADSHPQINSTPYILKNSNSFFNLTSVNSIRKSAKVEKYIYHCMSPNHSIYQVFNAQVSTIQDVIPLDLPEYLRLGVKTRLQYQRAALSKTLIVNSKFTADRLMANLHVRSNKIFSHFLPISRTFLDFATISEIPKFDLPESLPARYVLALVDFRSGDPRKRYHWVSQLAEKIMDQDISMVLMGKDLSKFKSVNCYKVDSPSDLQMIQLFRKAICFYFPSGYEGQGMPPWEAISQDCPVIAYNNSSISETLEEYPLLIADPSPWQSTSLSSPLSARDLSILVSTIKELSNLSLTGKIELSSKIKKKILATNTETFGDFLHEAYSRTF